MLILTAMASPFQPKFSLLEQAVQDTLVQQAREIGAYETAKRHAEGVSMSFWGLYEVLKKKVRAETPKEEGKKESKKTLGKERPKEHRLTQEEKEFLEGLKNGTIGLSETSRFVAVRVFENMLRNPHEWAYLDFFRTELLRLKNEETQIKDAWAKEIIGRFFAGKLPPRACPSCGYNLASKEEKVINGEIVHEPKLPPHV